MRYRARTDLLVVHCSDTRPSMGHINEADIRQWHIQRGWEDAGYNVVIPRRPAAPGYGLIEIARPLDLQGAHVRGYNHVALGICLVGGMSERGKPEDNFLPEQLDALANVIRFCLAYAPNAKVCGHNFLDTGKTCPNFDVWQWAQTQGFPLLKTYDELRNDAAGG